MTCKGFLHHEICTANCCLNLKDGYKQSITLSIFIVSNLPLCVHPQVHIFSSRPSVYHFHHRVIICQTYSQCLRFKLLRPPPGLHSGCGDATVVKLWCFWVSVTVYGTVLLWYDNQLSLFLCLSCTDQKALRLGKLSVALWVLAIICWISDRFGCSFWQRLNFCYLHGIW